MITVSRTHIHPSSGAHWPPDIAVTVNINVEFNLMAVNPIIEGFSRDLISKYCQGVEASADYTAPPVSVETLPGRSNRSVARLPLHMPPQAIIPTFLTSNIYIGQCLPNALALTRLQWYEMFDVLLIIKINKRVDLQ